eukprot:4734296-Prymnesium_polylepis.1
MRLSFASHSSRLHPSLRLSAAWPPRPSLDMTLRLAGNGVRWPPPTSVLRALCFAVGNMSERRGQAEYGGKRWSRGRNTEYGNTDATGWGRNTGNTE